MSMADGALSAKAKAMYGHRLKEKDYLELLKKRSVSEVTAYLKSETVYQSCLKDVQERSVHRGQLEKLLRRNMFDRLFQLYRYAGKKQEAFYKMTLKQVEIHLILNRIGAIRSHDINSAIADMPLYLNAFMDIPLDQLIAVYTFDELLAVLNKTIYKEVFQSYDLHEEALDYTALETELQRSYFRHVFCTIDQLFHGKTKKDLHTIVATSVELSNITKLYRLKKFYHESEANIRHALIDYPSRLSRKVMEDMIAAPDAKALLAILADSAYKIFADDDDYVYIEYYADKITYRVARRFMYFSSVAPLVFSAYQQLMNLEVNNLITLIEGVRYGIPSDEVQSMLIY